jgi:hypothetical protein
VPAVIEQDGRCTYLGHDMLEEFGIPLIADEDLRSRLSGPLPLGDIKPEQPGSPAT